MERNTNYNLFFDTEEISEGAMKKRCILCSNFINVGPVSHDHLVGAHKIKEECLKVIPLEEKKCVRSNRIDDVLESERNLCLAISIDNLPLKFACSDGMMYFLSQIGVNKVSRNVVAEKISELSLIVADEMKLKINNTCSITSYIDHSTIQKEEFCVINLTFIDKDFVYNSYMLDFCFVTDKSSDTTVGVVRNVMSKYSINFPCLFSVTDGASDLGSAFRTMKEFKHLTCFSHRIHNTIINSLKSSGLYRIICKISKLIKFINKNTNFYRHFKDFLTLNKVTDENISKYIKRVQRFSLTRWNSLFFMTCQIECSYEYIKKFIVWKDKWNVAAFPNEEEISILKFLNEILGEFSKIQLIIMQSRKGNISKVTNLLDYCFQKIQALNMNFYIIHYEEEFGQFMSSLLKQFGTEGYLDYNRTYTERELLQLAEVLNPLNFVRIDNHICKNTLLNALKNEKQEYDIIHRDVDAYHIDSIASKMLIKKRTVVSQESLDVFLSKVYFEYERFNDLYFQNTQDIFEKYIDFNVIDY